MCGLAGILHFGSTPDAAQRIRAMADAIAHRGPDDEGFWSNADVALGFRRLAIVDLETGAQPMSSADGRIKVVYNGEIYNHRELRAQLEERGHVFLTHHSDTEVLIHGWLEWGLDLPKKLNGMFAFAIWDQKERSLFLARDRFGIKPLYISKTSLNAIVFGSEVRALFASKLIPREENAGAVLEYFGLLSFWNGSTPFRGVELMQPATWRLFTSAGERSGTYWRWSFNRRRETSPLAAAEEFRALVLNAVKRQVQADVPVMSYLSGGINSSSVTAAAHALDPSVRAYSCIFDLTEVGIDSFVDEREFSRSVAEHLNIERVELQISRDSLAEQIGKTIGALEYPMMGMAYVNDMIAARVAQDAKVVLSGTGGDEVTGGYVTRYGIVPRGPSVLDPFSTYRASLNVPIADSEREAAFTPDFLRAAGAHSALNQISGAFRNAPSDDPWDVVMHVDATTYLHGLLVMEDKLSMAHSLETRVPLLDNVLVDYLLETPWPLLTDGVTGKILFREAVRPLVPDSIYKKPKMGFAPPDASWYRGPLRPYIESVLSPRRIAARGVFQPEWVARKVSAHMNGEANWVVLIWCLLSFEIWCDQNAAFGGQTTLAA